MVLPALAAVWSFITLADTAVTAYGYSQMIPWDRIYGRVGTVVDIKPEDGDIFVVSTPAGLKVVPHERLTEFLQRNWVIFKINSEGLSLYNDEIGYHVPHEQRVLIHHIFPEPGAISHEYLGCYNQVTGEERVAASDDDCIKRGGGRDSGFHWGCGFGKGYQHRCKFYPGRKIVLTNCESSEGKTAKYMQALHVDNCRRIGGVWDSQFPYEVHKCKIHPAVAHLYPANMERMECPVPIQYDEVINLANVIENQDVVSDEDVLPEKKPPIKIGSDTYVYTNAYGEWGYHHTVTGALLPPANQPTSTWSGGGSAINPAWSKPTTSTWSGGGSAVNPAWSKPDEPEWETDVGGPLGPRPVKQSDTTSTWSGGGSAVNPAWSKPNEPEWGTDVGGPLGPRHVKQSDTTSTWSGGGYAVNPAWSNQGSTCTIPPTPACFPCA